MLKLKLQYFGHLMRRADSFEKTLMLGGTGGRRRRGRQRMKWLGGITDLMDMSLSELWEMVILTYPSLVKDQVTELLSGQRCSRQAFLNCFSPLTSPGS